MPVAVMVSLLAGVLRPALINRVAGKRRHQQVEESVGRSRYAEEMRRKSCDWIHDIHLAPFGEGALLDQPL